VGSQDAAGLVLRLDKLLNQCGYTVVALDAVIEREAKTPDFIIAVPGAPSPCKGVYHPWFS
jgi:hypothetical protein